MSDEPVQRLEDLESRLAFLDDAVEQLSSVVARQDREIQQLQQRVTDVADKLEDLGGAVADGDSTSQHEIPPHY